MTKRPRAGNGPDIGEIFAAAVARHEVGAVAEAEKLYRAVLQRDSNHIGARCNIAQALHHLGNLEPAARAYLWLIARDVHAAEIHNGLGMALQELGRDGEAIGALRRGLAVHPGNADLLNSLGIALRGRDRLDEAATCYRRAAAANPANALAYLNLGNALREQGHLDLAIGCYRQCLSLRPDFGAAHHTLAMALLARGDLPAGWEEFEWRSAGARRAGRDRHFTGAEWRGEAAGEGRRLFLHAEEGLGDTIQFVRYAQLAVQRGFDVTLEVQRPLLGLMAGLPGAGRLIAVGDDIPPYDFHCPLLSLPRIFRTDLATIPAPIPYLSADPALAASWRERLSDRPGFKVGIAWRGNPLHLRDRKRSLSLAWFLDRLDRPGIEIVGLQKDFARAEFPSSRQGTRFLDAGSSLANFADTAALAVNLDLLISVDTAVCHLGGALGLPVWTLIDHAPDWRWLTGRSDSPWYPAMRLFRQDGPGNWDAVARQIEEALVTLRR